ncbi:Ferredoxin-NADP reductase [gamma proteobacterium HdN1]|nr:Ferredoxin-NADP reductase [gamma proteobacterium HdN1]
MSNMMKEKVLSVHHWNDTLFSFTTTRDPGFRFKSGQFIMIGLEVDGRPLMRAYSIASPHYEETLEYFSIKVQDGPLTSRLQKIQPGDEIMMSKKPTGTLILENLLPGRNLWLLSTGTGLAPFMSIIRDPETYEQYDKVIVTHGVRVCSELAYEQLITKELPENEYYGDQVREKLIYFPTVTREPFRNQGRLTDMLESGELEKRVGLPPVSLENDRFMLCGSPSMLKDFCAILDAKGFTEARQGDQGHYTIERAFVEK